MRPDLGRRLAPGAEADAGAPRRALRRRVRRRRRAVGAGRADACGAHPGRRSADAARRRLAHRAAGRRPPRTGRDRRRHRRVARRRLRRRSDRRAPGPDRAGQHGRLSDLAAAARDTTDADRNCISNIRPDGIGYADAAFKLAHMLRAMRAGASPACSLKMTRIGCRLALPSKPSCRTPRAIHEDRPRCCRRIPARVPSGVGTVRRGILQVPRRHHHGRLQRRQHLRHRDAHGGAAHRQAHTGKSDRHSRQPTGRRQPRRGEPGLQRVAARRHRDRRVQPQHPDRAPARLQFVGQVRRHQVHLDRQRRQRGQRLRRAEADRGRGPGTISSASRCRSR